MRLLTLALIVPLAACSNWTDDDSAGVPANGSGSARSYEIADFTAVDLRGPDDVDVRVGAGFSVRVEGDPKGFDTLKIERVGETLRVGRTSTMGISWGSNKGMKIYVTMPRIASASIAGSGDMAIDRVEGAAFDGTIAGSGELSLGTVAVQDLELSIAGSGNVAARGATGSLTASIAGSGDVEAKGLTATRADIKVTGSGGVEAAVNGTATVVIMGSGDVDLGPKARCQTTSKGSGNIRCGG